MKFGGSMQGKVDVAVMIGSGVPANLRSMGRKVCWVVLLNGERRGTAFSSRDEAEECKAAWLAQLSAESPGSLH
ncbi:hypothetical protein D9M68_24500 [compost metagenome]|uniref:Uncharacterized protein n=3 Tax=Pseudomonas TaxID=286 RepID=A0A1H4TQ62_PSEJE|nr:hypothetical protein SAMN04490187_4915 [Pseudomonas jessenii]VVP82588.1 hypothetical protein PS922_01949 [Pseudomonas fluorescens]